MKHFGEHLMIDGYEGEYERLNDKDLVLRSLEELPGKVGMTKLAKPEVYFAEGNDKKDPGGWSGFVVITESHISVHTFPARRFVSIDVYTCKEGLDRDYINDYFVQLFGLEKTEINLVKRGLQYPSVNTSIA